MMTPQINALRLIHHYMLGFKMTMNNIRVFLDTHLMKIRNISHNQKLPTLKHIISKHNASIPTGSTTVMLALNYVTKAMMMAEFREIRSDEFKRCHACGR